jgi:threonine dehydrogenase-like Zn-dependent dehydrogenase
VKALLFQYSLPRFVAATILGKLSKRGYFGPGRPLNLVTIPDPVLPNDDWVIVRTQLCGLCGSDSKQVFLDGNFDNPLTAFISFPQVLGHEAVGIIEETGPNVKEHQVGDRVLLNPWLPCGTRGINPPCEACQRGQYFVCENFTGGELPPGMHTGNNRAVTGGFAPHFPAHESQLFPIPDSVSFEDAVLTDPTSVSLHAILKAPPEEGGLVVVYGCGTLGLATIALLRELYPSVDIIAIARYPHQEAIASQLGAKYTIRTKEAIEIIERVAEIVGGKIHRPWNGKPMILKGANRIYDTVGSPESIEVGVRIAQPYAKLVISGVANPKRFEWTPLYFKEIELIGSNAFGIETFEGKKRHTFNIYLDLLKSGRINLSGLITHRYKLDDYQQAFLATHNKRKSHAVKAIFDYQLNISKSG